MQQAGPVRLGVVGPGNIGRKHIDNVVAGHVPECAITALCSRHPPDAAIAPGAQHFSSLEALLDSGRCDAVIVATPTCNHLQAGAAVLRSGLHLMMEKPLGLSIAEGEALLAQQGPAQVFALMLNQRTDPLFTAMRDCIDSGQLGELTRTQWTMTHWFRPEVYFKVSDWRATWKGEGGGLLLNQCIHNLDVYQWLCGMPASLHAFCRFGRYHDIEVEDEVSAFFSYASGASGVFVGSTGESPGVNRFDVIGDSGSLCFDGERLLLTQNAQSTQQYSRTTRDMFGQPPSHTRDITPERAVNQHAIVLDNFVQAIRNDEPLIAPAREGLNSLALANAMLLSSWENTAVDLPLDAARYQQALEQRMAVSQLRKKQEISATIDMDASFR